MQPPIELIGLFLAYFPAAPLAYKAVVSVCVSPLNHTSFASHCLHCVQLGHICLSKGKHWLRSILEQCSLEDNEDEYIDLMLIIRTRTMDD